MARYFLDSSALVKRYHLEQGTESVDRLFQEPGNRFVASRLAVVEVFSALARLVREGVLTRTDFGRLIARLDKDVAEGVFAVAAVNSERLAAATGLLGTLGLSGPLRTLDAIHLATAQALNERSRLAAVVAADQKLLTAAGAIGLPLLDVG